MSLFNRELALNTIGYIAAGLITICLMPQLFKIISTKNVDDISWLTYTLLLTAEILWLAYGIILDDLRIIVANVVSGMCSATILILYFTHKKRK
jgi:MtN3 and saliva related transmembrane protein